MKRKKMSESKALVVAEQPVDFCEKYRPKTWDEVLGHTSICKSIRTMLDTREKSCFVLTGESGTGKTTLARVMVNHLNEIIGKGEKVVDYKEVDAATYNGIDQMRELVNGLAYYPLNKNGIKFVCVDEAHSISKPAWQSLLKAVEEPRKYVRWVFCTTEAGKIPATIMTRCACFNLKPVSTDLIFGLLELVNEDEKLNVSDDILDLVAKSAQGSPRRALSYLAQVRTAKNRKIAAALLQTAQDDPEIRELCQGLVYKGITWAKALRVLKGKDDLNPESLRVNVVRYVLKSAADAKDGKAAGRALEIIDNFLPGPYYVSNGLAEFYVALGKCLLR